MYCPICGKANDDQAMFCSSCGSALPSASEPAPEVVSVAEPVQTPAAPEATTDAPAEAKGPGLMAKLQPVLDKVKPVAAKVKPFVQKNKLLLAGIACILILVICISLIVSVCTSGNGYITAEHAYIADVVDDELVVIRDKKVIYTGIETSGIIKNVCNLDRTIFAVLTSDNELVVVNGTKVKTAAEDVVDFEMSASGAGIAYITKDGGDYSLCLYKVSSKKSKTITDEYRMYAYSDIFFSEYNQYCISPDGKSVAYFDIDSEENEATLMYFNGSKNIKITSSEVELLGLSNGGKYIYVLNQNDDGDQFLYSYNTKGERTKIDSCSSSTVYFNDDHTQILFFNDSKSYISAKAKEGVKISSGSARLILAGNSATCDDDNTYPVEDLYGKVYRCYSDGKYNLWIIKKNTDKSAKLASGVSQYTLDAEAEYVYYLNDESTLKVLKISHGDNASDKAKTIAEDVDNYVVTSDRSRVYFISDNSLYSCSGKNGNGKRVIANDDVSTYYLALNEKDVVYYVMDGDAYACSNGKKGTKVVTDCEGLIGYYNGVVYVVSDDTIYATTGAKKVTKILTME